MTCSVADCTCVVPDVYLSDVDTSLCLLTRPEVDMESVDGPGRDTM